MAQCARLSTSEQEEFIALPDLWKSDKGCVQDGSGNTCDDGETKQRGGGECTCVVSCGRTAGQQMEPTDELWNVVG